MTVTSDAVASEVDVEALRAAVEAALADHVARFLDSHGGAVRVGHVSKQGDVTLEFLGACTSCPAVPATFYSSVLPTLRKVPGVRRVETAAVQVSEAAVLRILNLSNKSLHPPRESR